MNKCCPAFVSVKTEEDHNTAVGFIRNGDTTKIRGVYLLAGHRFLMLVIL